MKKKIKELQTKTKKFNVCCYSKKHISCICIVTLLANTLETKELLCKSLTNSYSIYNLNYFIFTLHQKYLYCICNVSKYCHFTLPEFAFVLSKLPQPVSN